MPLLVRKLKGGSSKGLTWQYTGYSLVGGGIYYIFYMKGNSRKGLTWQYTGYVFFVLNYL